MSFTYQWRRNGANIPGAISSNYTLVGADTATAITCRVTATNALGSTGANSNTLIVDNVAGNTSAPAISGGTTVGTLLTCTPGTWTYSPTSFAYQWKRNGTNISGATGNTYLLISADVASAITCAVTATNPQGVSAPATSNTIAVNPIVTGTTTVTSPNGQWWKLSGTVENGVYVNGDVWVKTSTTVEVIEIGPVAPYGTGTGARHGGMINPTFNTLVESNPSTSPFNTTAMQHGWDGRVTLSPASATYNEAYNAHADLPSLILSPGDSLVSSVSWNPTGEIPPAGNPISCLKMACLTVVNYTPFADEFRPAYFGTTNTRRRFSELNTALIPNLSAMSPFNPKGGWDTGFHLDEGSVYSGDVAEMHKNSMRYLQFFVYPLGMMGSLLKPYDNMHWYPRDWGDAAGVLSMYIMINPADRDIFITNIVQTAIDAYAAVEGEGFVGQAPFVNGAGFYNSAVWFIRFAGLLFDDTDMQEAHLISTGKTNYLSLPVPKYGEFNRTYLSSTAHAQYRRVPGEDYTAGFPLYGDTPSGASPPSSTANPGDNRTTRDPNDIYDMHWYSYGLPVAAFPDILDDTYEGWHVGATDYTDGTGTYMNMTDGMQAYMLASYAMGDEEFWDEVNPAVRAFSLRTYYDPQMWSSAFGGWGYYHDYSNGWSVAQRNYRDSYGCGGTGSGWMLTMWEGIVGILPLPPTVTAYTPLDGATGVAAAANLTVQFDLDIQFGTGDINIYRASDDVLFENFDVVTHAGTKLTISGDTLTINPSGTMADSTGYYVQIDATAIQSVDYQSFAGIADETTWNFTTAAGGASSFSKVNFSSDKLEKATGAYSDGTEFTLVMRCKLIGGTGTYRNIVRDTAGWFQFTVNNVEKMFVECWSASAVVMGCAGTTENFVEADGAQTIFISGRTTGTPVFHCWKGGTDMVPTGVTATPSGIMKFGVPNWELFNGFPGEVEFIWADNVYHDVSDGAVRAKFASPSTLGANGELVSGTAPKIYYTGNAAAWNSGVNLGTGGNFTMVGAVMDV